MKYGKHTANSICRILTQQALYYPLIPVALTRLAFHFSLSAVVLFLASLAIFLLTYLTIRYRHDKNINYELLSYLKKYANYRFQPTDLRKIIEKYAPYEYVQGIVCGDNLRDVGIAYMAKRKNKGRLLKYPESFPRIKKPNIVILPGELESYSNDINGAFKAFHEMGHLTRIHTRVATFSAHSVAGLMCTLFLCLTALPWQCALPAAALSIQWYWGNCAFKALMFSRGSEDVERIADGFAIKILRKHPKFEELERNLMECDVKRADYWRESMEDYKKWFDDIYDMEDYREKTSSIIRRLSPSSSSYEFLMKYAVSDDAVNFNSMIESHCFPQQFLSAYLLCALLIAGTYLCPLHGWRFWLTLLVPFALALWLFTRNLHEFFLTSFALERTLDGEEVDIPIPEKSPFQKYAAHVEKKIKELNQQYHVAPFSDHESPKETAFEILRNSIKNSKH